MTTFKAVYQGNLEREDYGFTIGREYEVEGCKNNHIMVTDDNGSCRNIKNGSFHKFSFICESQEASVANVADEKEASLSYRYNSHNEMKYKMNGVDVTKSFFEEKLIEVEHLKSRGVSVFIDFEVGFE